MTRINAGIPVKRLSDQHLLTEYYELPRVCTLYWKRKAKNHKFDDIPRHFTLGSGHVKFFLDKGKFLYSRYCDIINELILRGYKLHPAKASIFEFDEQHFNDHEFTDEDNKIVIDRITEKVLHINRRKSWSYYGNRLTPQECVDLISGTMPSETLLEYCNKHFLKTFL